MVHTSIIGLPAFNTMMIHDWNLERTNNENEEMNFGKYQKYQSELYITSTHPTD